ncbi:phosphoketolase [Mycoplasmopsis verecunda]|uniref:Xylulose-5-phosphate/fructose-6-phosphate phosphoketolase n=1 Tax=Mycoplasmopsis verecunda TaxID=171291 RepID=A0A1T4LVT4_9BACT|nr:phosphoketolase family protein [Mycoplasmopsis verecunda]WPB54578.1 phosphoketolase family protein [Mycoplasmopsis verecunda]SJZ58849.1 xylulose-5-phosphate/fructose-6-phosphate phosphoketolase [Mycoplasmopsis verecunda]
MKKTLFDEKQYLDKVHAWWRAANYLSVAQIYLRNNPLMKDGLKAEDVKMYPIGHWGTIPGQNLIYAHLNRVINKYGVNMFYIEGPGHGGQVMISNSYLDGSYTELFPEITQDEDGIRKMCKRFSFPGGTASHAAPETPGSIHEGGELGYSLSHATGAILDNPNIIAAAVIGDGEAETGPLAAGWFSTSFINPVNDGAVLPIIHINGGKISNPTIMSRKTDEEISAMLKGYGWEAIFVEANVFDQEGIHTIMAEAFDKAVEKILEIQAEARKKPAEVATRPIWPALVVRTPKGWTCPHQINGETFEGSFRSHQVPLPVTSENPKLLGELQQWLESYRPHELFDANGKFKAEYAEIAPKGDMRMAMQPITNGGVNPRALNLPNWREFGLEINKPGEVKDQDMVNAGKWFADVIKRNPDNFRVFGPDETKSNRLYAVLKLTNRQWLERVDAELDEAVGPVGRVIDSQLSEHQAEGFLEGYVLTGRHGFFASYESFLRVVDSMLTQHMKWVAKARKISWRKDYPSLNVIATSTAFQQDHNGYTHQDPGILGHLADKKPELIREYLPADSNSLLAVLDKAFAERDVINLIVASKQPRDQFYNMDEAQELVDKGLKVIDWASTVKEGQEPDLVVVASGTEPNLEALATISILNKYYPDLKIRFVNVVDLLRLRHPSIDPRGLSDEEFNTIFTENKPVLFAFHGFEGLIRDIFFSRKNHNLFVHGYRENGDITTSFDIRLMSEMDRFHMSITAANAVYGQDKAHDFVALMEEKIAYHNRYIKEVGIDIDEVRFWKWEGLNK